MAEMSAVDLFVYAVTLVFGVGVGFAASCVVIIGAFRVADAINALSERLPALLDRYTNRNELVIEEYDDYSRVTTVVYAYPKPDRVRLAKAGEPGVRCWRETARKMRAA